MTRHIAVDATGEVHALAISTVWQTPGGFEGWVQWRTMPFFMRRIYREELQQLDKYARANVI